MTPNQKHQHLTYFPDLRVLSDYPGQPGFVGRPQDPQGGPGGLGVRKDPPLWTPENFDLARREGRPQPPPPREGQAFLPTSPLVHRPRGTDFASRPTMHHRPRADFQKPTLSRYFLYGKQQ